MEIKILENYELLGIVRNGFYSDRYKRPCYDAIIDRKTECGRYVVCYGYCVEDGSWDDGRYYDKKSDAFKQFNLTSCF